VVPAVVFGVLPATAFVYPQLAAADTVPQILVPQAANADASTDHP
jgi:hypothetical protein